MTLYLNGLHLWRTAGVWERKELLREEWLLKIIQGFLPTALF